MRLGLHAFVAAFVLSLKAVTCVAQCGEWLPGFGIAGVGSGDSARVHCITEWDPDGAGPASPRTVFGGDFAVAGTSRAMCVAVRNGDTIEGLGTGIADGRVLTLAVHNGDLYAGGSLHLVHNPEEVVLVARLVNGQWHAVPGLSRLDSVGVQDLESFQGRLVAFGLFTPDDHGVASWDGQSWDPGPRTPVGVRTPRIRRPRTTLGLVRHAKSQPVGRYELPLTLGNPGTLAHYAARDCRSAPPSSLTSTARS